MAASPDNAHFYDPANIERFRTSVGLPSGAALIEDSIADHSRYSNLDWGVPLTRAEAAELWRRNELQTGSDKAVDYALAQADFSGMYWDQKNGGTGIFKFTGDLKKHEAAIVSRVPQGQVVEVTKAPMTLKDMQAIADDVFRDADGLAEQGILISSVRVDPVSEKVLVGLREAAAGAKQTLVSMYDTELIGTFVEGGISADACSGQFDCGDPPSEPWKGGIRIKSAFNDGKCTSSFLARQNSNNNLVMVTAGHCLGLNGGAGRTWYHNDHRNIGQSLSGWTWANGATSDVGWIDVSNPGDVSPKNEFLAEDASDIKQIQWVRPNDYQQVGLLICRSAVDSGYWCGKILGRNVSSRDVDGRDIVNLYTADFDAIPGDSGGIYFVGSSVYGIHADSLDNTSPPAGKSWYTPAERVENQANLTICTSSGC